MFLTNTVVPYWGSMYSGCVSFIDTDKYDNDKKNQVLVVMFQTKEFIQFLNIMLVIHWIIFCFQYKQAGNTVSFYNSVFYVLFMHVYTCEQDFKNY